MNNVKQAHATAEFVAVKIGLDQSFKFIIERLDHKDELLVRRLVDWTSISKKDAVAFAQYAKNNRGIDKLLFGNTIDDDVLKRSSCFKSWICDL